MLHLSHENADACHFYLFDSELQQFGRKNFHHCVRSVMVSKMEQIAAKWFKITLSIHENYIFVEIFIITFEAHRKFVTLKWSKWIVFYAMFFLHYFYTLIYFRKDSVGLVIKICWHCKRQNWLLLLHLLFDFHHFLLSLIIYA